MPAAAGRAGSTDGRIVHEASEVSPGECACLVTRLVLAMTSLAVTRPSCIPTLLTTAWCFRAHRWYARPPFLPIPSPRYLRWRMDCAYGDPNAAPSREELMRFLLWAERARANARKTALPAGPAGVNRPGEAAEPTTVEGRS